MAKKKSSKKKSTKVRTAWMFVDGSELERIVNNELGGITFKAEVHHSRIVLTAMTGEDEKVNASVF